MLVGAFRRQHCETAGNAFEGSKQADGEWLATFSIITTGATDDLGQEPGLAQRPRATGLCAEWVSRA